MKIILVAIFLIAFLNSCRERKTDSSSVETKAKVENKVKPSLNFYIEDGGSMHGFFREDSDFNKSVANIYRKVKLNSKTDRLTFIQNKKLDTVQFLKNQISIIENIEDYDREDLIGESNLYKMIEKCLNETDNNTVSALVSDFIYSDYETPNFQNKLSELLDEKGKDVCIIKLSSFFSGKYYYEKNNPKLPEEINCRRPYYIWFFGNSDNFRKLNITNDDTYSNINGFEDFITFSKTDFSDKIEYTILPYTNKIGRFEVNRKFSKNNKIKGLQNVENDRNGSVFQFVIAVDFSQIPLSNSDLIATSSYYFDLGNYKIINVSKLKKYQFEKSVVDLADQKIIDNHKYTHILTIQSNSIIPNDIELNIKKKIPNWLLQSNSKDENQIQVSNKTYNFSNFSNALDQVYNDEKSSYGSIKLKIDQGKDKNNIALIFTLILILIVISYLMYKKRR